MKTFYREIQIKRSGINKDGRTVELSFSSEEPYERYFGVEILGHKAGEIRLKRISSGSAPLLSDHDRTRQIGVVESVQIVGGKGRAVVRFSKRPEAEAEFQDVLDGIRSNISVGYMIHEKQFIKEVKGLKYYRAVDWEPMEISIVSIPADDSIGVGRNNSQGDSTMPENIETSNPNENKRPRTLRREAAREAREEITEIIAIGDRLNLNEQARAAISEGWTLDQFKQYVMDHFERRQSAPPMQGMHEIGMSRRDKEKYSFVRALRAVALGQKDPRFIREAGFEFECSDAAARQQPGNPSGLIIPHDMLAYRTLTAGTATDGAELVADNLLAGSFIDVLRNLSAVLSLGAIAIHGLVGNVLIPRKTSGASAGWISAEGGDVGNSEAQFDQVSMTPKTLGCYSDMTRNLLLQSTPDIEQIIKADLAAAVATAIDLACLYGTGSNGQPTGIVNQTGINAPTAFAAAVPTWAEVVAMESAVAVDNALRGSTGYMFEPAMAGSLKTSAKVSGHPVFIMEQNDRLNGHRCAVTSQVTAGDVFFGNWADLLIGFWGGLDVLVDPYTNSLSGTVRIVVHQSCDVAVRHPVSFAFNNDTV